MTGGDDNLTTGRKVKAIWLIVFAISAAGLIIGRSWSMIIGGLILLGFSLAVALNLRGLTDSLQRRGTVGRLWIQQSPMMIRLGFGFFAFCGALMVFAGLVDAVS